MSSDALVVEISDLLRLFLIFATEFELQGARLVRNERKEISSTAQGRRRYVRELRIETSSGNLVDFRRHGSEGTSSKLCH